MLHALMRVLGQLCLTPIRPHLCSSIVSILYLLHIKAPAAFWASMPRQRPAKAQRCLCFIVICLMSNLSFKPFLSGISTMVVALLRTSPAKSRPTESSSHH